jgi:hypothetical protein
MLRQKQKANCVRNPSRLEVTAAIYSQCVGRDSVVGIVTRCGQDSLEIESQVG